MVSLVVLDDMGNLREIELEFPQVLLEVEPAIDVGLEAIRLRVSYEHEAIDLFENCFAAQVVKRLTGHREKAESRLEVLDLSQRHRNEVEKQSSLGLGAQRHHLAPVLRIRLVVDVLQVGRFPTGATRNHPSLNRALFESHQEFLTRGCDRLS